jgi:hypothetical protein
MVRVRSGFSGCLFSIGCTAALTWGWAGVATGQDLFAAGTTIPLSSRTTRLVAADLNGDAIPDLVANNPDIGEVSVLLGNGDASFQTPASYAVGASPNDVAVADLDGDSVPDIVVANFLNFGEASVLLGEGDGTFSAAVSYEVGSSPISVVVGDLDGDSARDVVISNLFDLNASVLLGNGDGTLQSSFETQFICDGPRALALADFDGDAVLDLATACQNQNKVVIDLGNGDGTFFSLTGRYVATLAVDTTSTSIAIGDLDGDGFQDVVSTDVHYGNANVLLGNGDGTLQPPVVYTYNEEFVSLTGASLGDLDGDGALDLAVSGVDLDVLLVMLGNGDGTLEPAILFPLGDAPLGTALADLDGDGDLDVASANAISEDIVILLNQSDPPQSNQLPGLSSAGLLLVASMLGLLGVRLRKPHA